MRHNYTRNSIAVRPCFSCLWLFLCSPIDSSFVLQMLLHWIGDRISIRSAGRENCWLSQSQCDMLAQRQTNNGRRVIDLHVKQFIAVLSHWSIASQQRNRRKVIGKKSLSAQWLTLCVVAMAQMENRMQKIKTNSAQFVNIVFISTCSDERRQQLAFDSRVLR